MKLYKGGFTLAEVLITLFIIGVVAAMTLPTLFANYNKEQTVTKLKRAIAILNQAYMMSCADNGEQDAQGAYNIGNEDYFKAYWAPYMHATLCTYKSHCGYISDHPWRDIDGKIDERIPVTMSVGLTSFTTPDGYLYTVYTRHYVGKETVPDTRILVDINSSKPPNKVGRDVFWLVRNDCRIIPYGYNWGRSGISNGCKQNGSSCAAKIRQDSWEIRKDYPW